MNGCLDPFQQKTGGAPPELAHGPGRTRRAPAHAAPVRHATRTPHTGVAPAAPPHAPRLHALPGLRRRRPLPRQLPIPARHRRLRRIHCCHQQGGCRERRVSRLLQLRPRSRHLSCLRPGRRPLPLGSLFVCYPTWAQVARAHERLRGSGVCAARSWCMPTRRRLGWAHASSCRCS